MGNRSRYVVAAAAVGSSALIARRRRARRLQGIAAGLHDAVLPTQDDFGPPEEVVAAAIEAHAPGHRHLQVGGTKPRPPRRLRGRPWTKNAHGMRHPFAGD